MPTPVVVERTYAITAGLDVYIYARVEKNGTVKSGMRINGTDLKRKDAKDLVQALRDAIDKLDELEKCASHMFQEG